MFRLSRIANTLIKDFVESGDLERFVVMEPKDADNRTDVEKANPGIEIRPLGLRLIRYEIDGASYFLGTTLTDKEKYPRDRFQELYGERWGIGVSRQGHVYLVGVSPTAAKRFKAA